MEYIEGADLDRLLSGCRSRGAQVPLDVAMAILRKICEGLHAAHTALNSDGRPLELVHRDVKSANVFVARNGAVKVGDFGIARANQLTRVNRTEVGFVKGTAAYMSPEQRTGGAVDRRTDVYGVGAIAYELFAGTAVNLDLARIAHLGREGWPHLALPSSLRPFLPAGIDGMVFRALAFEPQDRFASGEELEDAIEELANAHGLAVGHRAVAQWVEAELASGIAEPLARSAANS